jgi:hypothetical protein
MPQRTGAPTLLEHVQVLQDQALAIVQSARDESQGWSVNISNETTLIPVDTAEENEGLGSPLFNALLSPVMSPNCCKVRFEDPL